jgi:hypothetical protein
VESAYIVSSSFSKTKGFKIGERRQSRLVESQGPGKYNTDVAEALTKYRSPTIRLNSGVKRPASYAKKDKGYTAEAGAYENREKFGLNAKTFTISKEPREKPIRPTTGPGEYDV